jgi:hypothetical protein
MAIKPELRVLVTSLGSVRMETAAVIPDFEQRSYVFLCPNAPMIAKLSVRVELDVIQKRWP